MQVTFDNYILFFVVYLARRVSCADLGKGTHEGWLYARKPRKSAWERTTKWCVVKDCNLYIYASKMVSVCW